MSGAVGVAIERGVIRFLYGRPLETLLATFGISLMLQQLVRTVISPQNVPVSNPEFLSGFWQINSVLSLTYNRLYIFLFCLLVFAGLFFVLKYTRLGLQVRAVSQNRAMARAMGVRSARVDAHDLRSGFGHRRRRRCCAVAADQRRAEPRPGLHRRQLHGGGVRRRRATCGAPWSAA